MRSMKHLGPGLALAAAATLCVAGCGGDDSSLADPLPNSAATGTGGGSGGGQIGSGAGGGTGGGQIYSGGASGGGGSSSAGGGDTKDPEKTPKAGREASDGKLRLRAVPRLPGRSSRRRRPLGP